MNVKLKKPAETGLKSDKVWCHHELRFYLWDNLDPIDVFNLSDYDAVIISSQNVDLIKEKVKRFRSWSSSEIHLKPLFIIGSGSLINDPMVKGLVDGSLVSESHIDGIADVVRRIHSRKMKLDARLPSTFEGQLVNKLLGFAYTRSLEEINPVLNKESITGYVYPMLSINFLREEEGTQYQILNLMEEEGLLDGSFQDRVYICPSCSSGFLNYREVCSKCSSTHLHADDVVHHFPCAYIGPMKDFDSDGSGDLQCPKCDKLLHHIGVDYDKPSVVHTCQSCGQIQQNTPVHASCYSCETTVPTEQLQPTEIKSYTITKKGLHVAMNGYSNSEIDTDVVHGAVDLTTFSTILNMEVERASLLGSAKSCLGIINLHNVNQVYNQLGENGAYKLMTELVELVKSSAGRADMICFERAENLLLLQNEISLQEALNTLRSLKLLFNRLFEDRFPNGGVEIDTRSQLLTGGKNAQWHLNELHNAN